jgi:hypothetical protein
LLFTCIVVKPLHIYNPDSKKDHIRIIKRGTKEDDLKTNSVALFSKYERFWRNIEYSDEPLVAKMEEYDGFSSKQDVGEGV